MQSCCAKVMNVDGERKPLVLCLGMLYPCMEANIKRHLNREKKTNIDLDDTKEECNMKHVLQTATVLVESKILTEMDGHDLVHCQMIEAHCGADVVTVSLEAAALYRNDCHFDADFNGRRFVNQLKCFVGNKQFYQVVLDYFWIPSVWNETHWKRTFFEKVLINLVRSGLLCKKMCVSSIQTNQYGKGAIYLPFCLHCFKEVISLSDKLREYFNISFLRKDELKEIMLWSATQNIDRETMQLVFGKQLDQEELYCKVTLQQLKALSDDQHVTQGRLLDVAKSLREISDVQFIALYAK